MAGEIKEKVNKDHLGLSDQSNVSLKIGGKQGVRGLQKELEEWLCESLEDVIYR